MNSSIVDKKYYLRAALFMAGYTFFLIGSFTGAFDDIKPGAGWGLALAAAAPIAGHLWALLAWIHDSDEFVRALAAKRFMVTTGIVLASVSAWSLLEMHAHAAHLPGVLIVPFFWVVWLMVSPFIRTSH